MDDYYKYALEKKELDDAYSSFKSASSQNEEINREHREKLEKFYEHIALYSAGAISFSTTLIGLVLGKFNHSLSRIVFFLPNIYYLYASWVFFGIAFIAALLSKKIDAYYISAFGFANYTKKYRDNERVQLNVVKARQGDVLFTGKTTWEEQAKVMQSNIQKLERANQKNIERRDHYWIILKTFSLTAQISATMGLILLSLFAILLTQSVVFGNKAN